MSDAHALLSLNTIICVEPSPGLESRIHKSSKDNFCMCHKGYVWAWNIFMEGGKELIHTNTKCYIIGNLQECDCVIG